jgi:hypothetical protein
MQKAEVPGLERIIADTINETARGDPNALAAHIIAALGEAGYRILRRMGWRTPRSAISLSTNWRPRCGHRIPGGMAGIGNSRP